MSRIRPQRLVMVYRCNLRGIDVSQYRENPIVLRNWDYNGLPIGVADIMPGKTRVMVTYTSLDDLPTLPHDLGTSTMQRTDGSKILVGLAIIPVYGHAVSKPVGRFTSEQIAEMFR